MHSISTFITLKHRIENGHQEGNRAYLLIQEHGSDEVLDVAIQMLSHERPKYRLDGAMMLLESIEI